MPSHFGLFKCLYTMLLRVHNSLMPVEPQWFAVGAYTEECLPKERSAQMGIWVFINDMFSVHGNINWWQITI